MFPIYSKSTEHSINVNGSSIRYTVTAEDIPIHQGNNQAATMFTYGYVKTPVDTSRPVVFAYNGGPGADCVWLHFGFLGPKRIAPNDPPDLGISNHSILLENEQCLIEDVDFVLVDAPCVGYSQFESKEVWEGFCDTASDCTAFAECIERWLDIHNRRESNIILMGESYGTIRNVGIAERLDKSVRLCGIISIGTSLNIAVPEFQIEPSVRKFGIFASTAWYYFREGKPPLREHLRQADDFAYGDYARALMLGRRFPKEEYEDVLNKLVYFTGLSKQYLIEHKLRLDVDDYLVTLFPGELMSVYDSRLRVPYQGKFSLDTMDEGKEPSVSTFSPVLHHCLETYLKDDLELDDICRPYQQPRLKETQDRWNWDTLQPNGMVALESLMRQSESLRILFINGLYDMTSTFGFVPYYLSQNDIPEDRVTVRTYESGHMSYFGKSFYAMTDDVKAFIRTCRYTLQ